MKRPGQFEAAMVTGFWSFRKSDASCFLLNFTFISGRLCQLASDANDMFYLLHFYFGFSVQLDSIYEVNFVVFCSLRSNFIDFTRLIYR